MQLVEHLSPAAPDQVELVGAAAAPSPGQRDGAGGVSATLGLQLERVRAAQARGTRVELWFADEARIGQKNTLTLGMGPDRRPPRGRQGSRLHLGLCVWGGLPGRG